LEAKVKKDIMTSKKKYDTEAKFKALMKMFGYDQER